MQHRSWALPCSASVSSERACVRRRPRPLRFSWASETHIGSDRGADDLWPRSATHRSPGLLRPADRDVTDMGIDANFRAAKDILDGLDVPITHPRQSRHEVVGVGRIGFPADLGGRPLRLRERRVPVHRGLAGARHEIRGRPLRAPGRPLAGRGPGGGRRGREADLLRHALSPRRERRQRIRRVEPLRPPDGRRPRRTRRQEPGPGFRGPGRGHGSANVGTKNTAPVHDRRDRGQGRDLRREGRGPDVPALAQHRAREDGLPVVARGKPLSRGCSARPTSASTSSSPASGSAGRSTWPGRSPRPLRSSARRVGSSATPRQRPTARLDGSIAGNSRRTIPSHPDPCGPGAGSSSDR